LTHLGGRPSEERLSSRLIVVHTLVVSEQGVTVRAEGDLLVVERGTSRLRQVRVNEIDQVILLGRVEIRSAALSLILRRSVDLVLLTQQGTFRGRLSGRASKNVALRLAQYGRSIDPVFCLQVARTLVAAKIRHQRQVLLRAQRQLRDSALSQALGNLRVVAARARNAADLEGLRGLEGHAAAIYFGQFGKLIRNDEFHFDHRNRRPPRDPVNALLSFGYAVFGSLMETDVYRCGLDPMLGFLHQPDYGRPSLMLDVLESFRPLIDSLVLRLINRRQIGPGDFVRQSSQSLEEILSDQPDAGLEPPFDLSDSAIAEPSVRRDAESEPPASAADRPAQSGAPAAANSGNGRSHEAVWAVLLSDVGRRIYLHELFHRLREKMFYPPRSATYEIRDIVREQIYHLARVIEGTDSEFEPFVPM
jgi:CRISPR-associated protein Cas1